MPRTLHLGSTGKDVEAAKRAVYRYVDAGGQLEQMQSKPLVVRRFYGPGFASWVNEAHARAGQPRNGTLGPLLWAELREQGAIDAYADALLDAYAKEHPPVPQTHAPQLGPIVAGGRSVLLQDLTHETDGLPGFPAFDDGWLAGLSVVAPESCVVTRQSGSQGGDAFYLKGDSRLEYWVGHIAVAPATGTRFKKGQTMTRIASMSRPHVHLGINATALIGRELEHRTNYQHGGPAVGVQLARALT